MVTEKESLIGFPDNIDLETPSIGNPRKFIFAILDNNLLAVPNTAFCSCKNIGFLFIQHARPAGTVINPPKPIMPSIFSLSMILTTLNIFINT